MVHTWSRLIRFLSHNDEILLGEPTDPDMDIGLAIASGHTVSAHVLNAETPWDPYAQSTGRVEVVKILLSPLSAEMCGAIRAIGLNYRDHAVEMGLPYPSTPVLFFKPPNTLAHPDSNIPIPKCAQDEEMDYEVELAVVLGRDTKDVREDEAMGYVFGYTCANDLTSRKLQARSDQWGFSKGFDHFCPLGPCLVSTRALLDPHLVTLQTKLNGEVMQIGSTRKMIFSIAQIISYLSQGTTLPAGTVIITGTPPGIGDGRDPKVWLRDGDRVECCISHGIGTLVNDIVYQ